MKNIKGFTISVASVVFIIFCVAFANALSFDYAIKAKNDTIFPSETAIYQLNITNNNNFATRYQIFTVSGYWDIYAPPIEPVGPGNTAIIDVEITLREKDLTGPTLVPVTIKSLDDDSIIIENFYVYVRSTNQTLPSYYPSVALDVTTDSRVDPRQPLSLTIKLHNRNPLNMSDTRILLTSGLFKDKEISTTLGGLEDKTLGVLMGLDPLQQNGTYNINVKLSYKNISIAETDRQVEIESYSEVIVDQTMTKGLFSSQQKITLVNHGNYQATKIEKIPTNFFEKIFTTTSANYVPITENGVSYLSWTIPLEPEQTVEITVTTNYIILVIIIIVIILAIISYYVFRSPVLLFKNAKILSSSEDGVSEIKVKLHIKNRSARTIRNIKIIDKYPKIVQIDDETTLGMLKPTKMLSADKTHSLLMWNLEVLDPYEERLLTYKLKSSLNIVGNLSLPVAKTKFSTGAGERTYYSNDVQLRHKSDAVFKEV